MLVLPKVSVIKFLVASLSRFPSDSIKGTKAGQALSKTIISELIFSISISYTFEFAVNFVPNTSTLLFSVACIARLAPG